MTIPASEIVLVNPGVIGAGGSPLALNGVIMSKSTLLPTGSVRSFTDSDAVSAFFGPSSAEYAVAPNYFAGYDNSTAKPGVLYFAPYVNADRAAWLQTGSLADMSLAQLNALSAGTLIVTVDGTVKTSASIDLSGAASFTAAAILIAAGFTGGSAPTCAWNAVNSTFTLSSPTTGASSTIGYATGTLSAGLKFTAATGAIPSQGDVADTPTTAMNNVKAVTQNWATFTTMWEPVLAAKELFADWVQANNQRYAYVAWDTDAQAIVQNSTTNFGAVAKALEYNGVVVVYNTIALAVAELGFIASIDYAAVNGRVTMAFRSQSGLAVTVTDTQIASTLIANGYSYYGQYSTANDSFNILYDGQMAGDWLWTDSYVNQIQMNSQFQLALMSLLTGVPSIPYNEAGYSLIRAAMADPIASAISFGTIRVGVTLTASQKAQVNQAAGLDISKTLEQSGYYLQVLDPGATIKAARGTPVINFWYTDGGAVQKLTVASTALI